jgi:hypothetical protein
MGITQHKGQVKKIVSFLSFFSPHDTQWLSPKRKNVRHFKKQNAPLLVEEKIHL